MFGMVLNTPLHLQHDYLCLCVITNGSWSRYLRIDQVKFVEDSFQKIWSDMVYIGRPYYFKIIKGYVPQVLLVPFLYTLTQV